MIYENYGVTKRRVERNGKQVWCSTYKCVSEFAKQFDN